MQGDDFSSTDLHLANGDTLLVGQVAELEQADLGSNVHYRKLQVGHIIRSVILFIVLAISNYIRRSFVNS